MTIIATWLNKEKPTSPTLWTLTDSRLSKTDRMPLLNCGAKLFSIRIICLKPDTAGFFTNIYFSTTIGMTFAGSSLMGLSLYAFLSHTLGNLTDPKGLSMPSIEDISVHADAALKQLLINHVETSMNPARCEVSIFGSCSKSQEFNVFHITQRQSNPPIILETNKVDISDDIFTHLMGDFKAEISKEIANYRSSLAEKNICWWRSPKKIIQDAINENKYDTIGGGIQIGITFPNPVGFQAYSVIRPIKIGQPAATLLYQNIDLSIDPNLQHVGNCVVGVTGMV